MAKYNITYNKSNMYSILYIPLSSIVIVKLHVAMLFASSVAVQLTVWVPRPGLIGDEGLQVTTRLSSTLSVAVGFAKNTGVLVVTMLVGQSISGDSVSVRI